MAGSKYVSGAPLNNYFAVSSPTVNDDETRGYCSGSRWANIAVGVYGLYSLYDCVDPREGVAVWVSVI